ncbi:MAG: hypothetical protein BGO43_08115 [Gammaproteobacteria bacterium 39-13]|nr:hypothetical protein [Gammaproteobacteria bacterium]OJV93131.1 MAG: hypothetical protein BGO43_08115 [Gammaproteobacteria bacterium 39-13]
MSNVDFQPRTGMTMQIAPNHISLNSETKIRDILRPLTKFVDIHYFSYGVNYLDTSGFTLASNAEYYRSVLEKEFLLHGFHLSSGWHSWDGVLPSAQKYIAEELGIGNGILFVNHQKDKTEIIEFGSRAENRDIYNFYLNNLNLLKKFILHFTHEANHLITQAQNERIVPLPHMVIKAVDPHQDRDTHAEYYKFLYESSFPINLLSKREKECFLHLIKGNTFSEIGEKTGLAIPTISNYISRVKQKLRCNSKKEMVQIAHDSCLVDFDFDY